jgi:apolipoprotein N-acyltransferase
MAISQQYHRTINSGDVLAVICGVAGFYLSMPNPAWSFPPLVFMAFVPLFMLLKAHKGFVRPALSFLFSGLFALAMIFPADPSGILNDINSSLIITFLFLAIAAVYSTYFTLSALICDHISWKFNPLVFSLGWVITGILLNSTQFMFAFPVETSLVNYPLLINSARIFGAGGIAFIIIFTNAVLAYAITEHKKRTWIFALSVILAIHFANIGAGAVLISGQDTSNSRVNIAIIQPNVSSKEFEMKERDKTFKVVFEQRLMALTKSSMASKPDLIIWPERAGEYILQNDAYLAELTRLVTSKGPELLIGTSYIDHNASKTEYNIAFILKPDGDMTEPYRKQIRFPFSETGYYSKGKEVTCLPSKTKLRDIGTMICLESLYPAIAKDLVKKGAKALVCISNDASFGNSMIPYIHSAEIVFRAIENNRYSVHAGNSGPSIICDNKGRILTYVPYGRTAYAAARSEI